MQIYGTPGEIKTLTLSDGAVEISGDGFSIQTLTFITSIDFTNSKIKTRNLEIRRGIVTNISTESDWTDA